MNIVGKRIILAAVLLLVGSVGMWADPVSGTLFYTTFLGGTNVHKVDFDYDGTTFALSNNVGVTSTRGADGLLFAPDGNLLVAGQGNNLTEIKTDGTFVNVVAPGGDSFHLALSSNDPDALVYSMSNGSHQISAVTLSGGGLSTNGSLYTTSCPTGCSTDVRGIIFDPDNNTWYYGTAGDGDATGTFGTVAFDDALHTATLTQLLTGVPAHGLTFDPFTGDVIFSSASLAEQFDPSTGTVISTLTVAGQTWDQTAADGKGHLFLASNGGYLTFADYAATGLIGDPTNFTATPFLAGALDDIAPLSGIGAATVPEPTSVILLATAFLGLVALRKRIRRT